MGYLGKISAIVGVSTGDSAAKLNSWAGDVKSAAGRVQRDLSSAGRSASKSLDDMYTKLQRFERAKQAALSKKLDFSGLQGFPDLNLKKAAVAMEHLQSIAHSLSAPLAQIARQSESMGNGIQKSFRPALIAAQAATEALADSVDKTGKVTKSQFSAAAKQVDLLTTAFGNLAEAERMAASLSTGKSFQFQQPVAHQQLRQAQAVDSKVTALPADRMTPAIVNLIQQQNAAAASVARYNAAVASTPNAKNQAALDKQVVGLRAITGEISKLLAKYDELDASEAKIRSTASALAELRSAAAGALSGLPQNLSEAKAKYDQILVTISKLSAEQKRAFADGTKGGSVLDRLAVAVTSGEEGQLKKALELIERIDSELAGMHKFDLGQKEAAAETERLQQSIEKVIATYSTMRQDSKLAFTGKAQNLEQADQQRRQIVSQVGSMAPASRAFAAAKIEEYDTNAIAMISSGNEKQLPDVNDHLDKMRQVVASQLAADAAMKDTAEEANKLKKAQDSSAAAAQKNADALAQAFTGQAQNVDQVSSAYGTLISRIAKLTDAQRAQLQASHGSALADVGNSIARPEGADGAMSPQQVSNAQLDLASVGRAVDLFEEDTKAAKKLDAAVTALNDKLRDIAKSIGRPADPIDELDAAVKKATADVEKMKDPARKAIGQAALGQLQGQVTLVQGMSGDAAARAGAINKVASNAGDVSKFANEKTAKDIFGPAFGSAERSLDQLKTKITSVGGHLEKLPIPIQAKLAPAIARVQQMFVSMGDNPTAAQLKQAAAEAEKLEKRIGRLSQALKFDGDFGDFINDNSGKAYEAQLESIQRRFLALGAAASGPTADAINQYRAALSNASVSGTIGTKAVRDQMEQLAASIAKAAQAEGLLDNGQAASFLSGLKSNFGDVGRGGADKFAMGMNQAAFAVDDFMSATGGIEQRLRAVANNVTQLGFVIGQTKGLYIALGAVITAHAVIALYKFVNGGKSAEDRSKALNDALEKQKSGVMELANAYKDLSKEMSRSDAASKGVARGDMIYKLAEMRKSTRTSRKSDLADGVLEQSANVVMYERRLKEATSSEQAITLQQYIENSKAKEKVARSTAGSGMQIDPADLEQSKQRRSQVIDYMENSPEARVKKTTGFDFSGFSANYRAFIDELKKIDGAIKTVEEGLISAADDLAEQLSVASLQASDKILAAQTDVADAISRGVKGAAAFQMELDAAAGALSSAMMALYAAALESDPTRRDSLTQDAQARYDEAAAQTAGLGGKSRTIRLRNGLGGERATEALSAMEGNVNMQNQSAMLTAQLKRQIDAENAAKRDFAAATSAAAAASKLGENNKLEAQRKTSEAIAAEDTINREIEAKRYRSGPTEEDTKRVADARAATVAAEEEQARVNDVADASTAAANALSEVAAKALEAAQLQSDIAAKYAEMVLATEEAASRMRKVLGDALSGSTSNADAAQKRFIDAPTAANKKERDAAEQRLIDDKEKIAVANNRISRRRDQLTFSDPEISAYNERSDQIRNKILALEEEAKVNSKMADPAQIQDLRNEQASIDAARERRMRQMTKPEQEAADKIAQDIAYESRRQESVDNEKERVKAGKELVKTESQKRKKAATEEAEIVGGAAAELTDAGKRQKFVQGYFDNKKKELQTTLKGYEDERTNAIVGGPSRAALNASDVTTSAGSSELNRLLRGDDASKDVNFAEMKHQSELLAEIRDGIRDATGIIVN